MSLINRIYKLLSISQKKNSLIIIFLLIIGLLFEISSIGVIFPIFDYALHPEKIVKIQTFLATKEKISQSSFLNFSMISLLTLYFLKTIFLYYSIKKQNTFASEIVKDISNELFYGYINIPYTYHLNNNSSRLIRNINNETGAFLAFLQSSLILTTELAIIVSSIILLLFVEFKATLFLLVFLLLSTLIFNYLTKNKIQSWGRQRQFHDGEYARHLMQGLNGIKDIKILSKESYFVEKLYLHNHKRTEISIKNNTIQQIPRLYLEFISIFALSLLIIILIYLKEDISTFLPVLGIYAAAAFRLIPSLNRIFISLSTIKFHLSALDEIEKELYNLRENLKNTYNTNGELDFNSHLLLKNVSFNYDLNQKLILDNINIKIQKGETIGIIGESGAGKSTLVDIIIGLLHPTSGNIYLDDIKLTPENNLLRKIIGYVPQDIFFVDDTIEKNIAFGIDEKNINYSSLTNSIKNSQLDNVIAQLPDGIKTNIGERGIKLSGGQRQRIGIARALYINPSILVFDEATSALDSETERTVMDTINSLKGKITIILIAHRLSTLKNCDLIFEIKSGKATLIKT